MELSSSAAGSNKSLSPSVILVSVLSASGIGFFSFNGESKEAELPVITESELAAVLLSDLESDLVSAAAADLLLDLESDLESDLLLVLESDLESDLLLALLSDLEPDLASDLESAAALPLTAGTCFSFLGSAVFTSAVFCFSSAGSAGSFSSRSGIAENKTANSSQMVY